MYDVAHFVGASPQHCVNSSISWTINFRIEIQSQRSRADAAIAINEFYHADYYWIDGSFVDVVVVKN